LSPAWLIHGPRRPVTGSIGETPRHSRKAGSRSTLQQVSPSPGKDRALPHIGRDAVKISSPDGVASFSSCGGHSLNAKQGNSR